MAETPVNIAIYWNEERSEVGLFFASTAIPIVNGPDAELIFNNMCKKIEEIGYLGGQIFTPDSTKMYLIGKRK